MVTLGYDGVFHLGLIAIAQIGVSIVKGNTPVWLTYKQATVLYLSLYETI
jgi:hypothetical protein